MVSISSRKMRFFRKNFENKKNDIIQKNPTNYHFFEKNLTPKFFEPIWAFLSQIESNWVFWFKELLQKM